MGRVNLSLILVFLSVVLLTSYALPQGREKPEVTKPPAWAPSFPGFGGGGRGRDLDKEEWPALDPEEDDDRYITTYRRTSPRTVRTTTRYREDYTTTTPYYQPTTPPPTPWYKKWGNYAKDKFNSVYKKLG